MKTYILPIKLNTYLCVLIFVCTPKIYSQTLTAEQIYKKVTNAVVVIHTYDNNNQLSKQGSGVVLNDKGYVVTNYHLLAGCEKIEILHNKEIVPYADIIGIDVEKDILILKIKSKKFPAIKIGDSRKSNIGQRVYAIGSPLGFENSISEGIISGLRSYEEFGKNFIQITASISPGSSGGAVVNDRGELIGISALTAKEGQNLNFAIPIDDILNVEISSYTKNDTYKDFDLFYKGLDADRKGNYQEAIRYFTSFINEYPKYANAYFNRGLIKGKLQDYKGEVKDYDKAIEIDPNLAEAYCNRGYVKFYLEDYREAIQDFNKAIEIDPNYSTAYYNRGILEFNLQDYSAAIQDYNKAIEINPNYSDAYNNRGNAKAKLKDFREAIQDINKAIEITPNDAKAYYNRGRIKSNLEDYRGAIQDYKKAIEINPNFAEAYFNHGILINILGDGEGDCLGWSKAGELGIKKAYEMIRKYCN